MTSPSNCSVVVLISGSGSNLQALIDASVDASVDAHYNIAAVISNKPDAYGLARAQQAKLPTAVLGHKGFGSREAFDKALATLIDTYQPDLLVLAGFMRILTATFVQHFSGKILNIHPSLLPKYPGIHTHQRALDAGETEHGVSVHFVTEQLDGGPVIAQARVKVLEDDDAESLAQRVLVQEHLIYPQVVQWFAQGRLQMRANQALFDDTPVPITGINVN